MEVTGLTIPGYRVFEYQLVIPLPEVLRDKVRQLRQEYNTAYQIEGKGLGRSSLLLVNFVQYEMMEERISNRLRQLAMGVTPFKVELKDFGSFPAHSVYVQVATRLPVQKLVKEIRQETQRIMKLNDDNKPHFILEPHITLAARLRPWQYEKSWPEYSQKTFSGRFIADRMLLLKRLAGEWPFRVAGTYSFENMPVATRQGQLLFT